MVKSSEWRRNEKASAENSWRAIQLIMKYDVAKKYKLEKCQCLCDEMCENDNIITKSSCKMSWLSVILKQADETRAAVWKYCLLPWENARLQEQRLCAEQRAGRLRHSRLCLCPRRLEKAVAWSSRKCWKPLCDCLFWRGEAVHLLLPVWGCLEAGGRRAGGVAGKLEHAKILEKKTVSAKRKGVMDKRRQATKVSSATDIVMRKIYHGI